MKEHDRSRVDAIRKYRDRGMDAAALIAAVATARFPDSSPLCALRARHDQQLHNLLHDLAFNCRKAMELAAKLDPHIKSLIAEERIFGLRSSIHSPADAINGARHYSLFFVLGRLVHSEDVAIVRAHIPLEESIDTSKHELPWMFVISSDRDAKANEQHHIWMDELLAQVIRVDERIGVLLAGCLANVRAAVVLPNVVAADGRAEDCACSASAPI